MAILISNYSNYSNYRSTKNQTIDTMQDLQFLQFEWEQKLGLLKTDPSNKGT